MMRLLLLAGILSIAACAPLPQRAGIATDWQPSPNFGERRPNFVILHHTSDDTADEALRALSNPLRTVSAHYLVARDGRVIQLVDERARAWHAGAAKWGANTDINSASIGIELDNNGDEPYDERQIAALLSLLADIKQRLQIPTANFLGHADVAPRRKTDPSRHFPWGMLAQHGFGLWCDPPYAPAPAEIDTVLVLRALGYDTGEVDAALRAFKLHYQPQAAETGLDATGRALLYCLYLKSAG